MLPHSTRKSDAFATISTVGQCTAKHSEEQAKGTVADDVPLGPTPARNVLRLRMCAMASAPNVCSPTCHQRAMQQDLLKCAQDCLPMSFVFNQWCLSAFDVRSASYHQLAGLRATSSAVAVYTSVLRP